MMLAMIYFIGTERIILGDVFLGIGLDDFVVRVLLMWLLGSMIIIV